MSAPADLQRARAEVAAALRARRGEIVQATLTRVYAVSDPSEVADPTYLEGLRTAVAAAIDYGLAGIQSSERNPPPIPPALLVQARVAARSGVGLDTVLRRYLAGYALLGDFLIEEAESQDVAAGRSVLKRLLRAQARAFDRLLAAVSEEHRRDGRGRLDTDERRRLELVQRLLDGEPLDTPEVAYDFETIHLGLVARGPDAGEVIHELARALDRRLLMVCPDEQTTWAWLGGHSGIDRSKLHRLTRSAHPSRAFLAFGEPGRGVGGWRLTHRQARAALPIAVRTREPVIAYSDVALLASILQDDLLTTSLRELYLKPLDREPDGGELARRTLCAYFAAEGNVSSTAATLGVNRKTVTSRLRTIEAATGKTISLRTIEFEAALRIEALQCAPS